LEKRPRERHLKTERPDYSVPASVSALAAGFSVEHAARVAPGPGRRSRGLNVTGVLGPQDFHVGGNKSEAARLLGVDRKTLYTLLEAPGAEAESWRDRGSTAAEASWPSGASRASSSLPTSA